MLDYKAFAIEAARREFPVPSTETLLETAVKNAETWRAAYTQAQQQGEWTIARTAEAQVEVWTQTAARLRGPAGAIAMIVIKQSPTADTRTCDFTTVSKDTLYASSVQHISDVREALRHFEGLLRVAAYKHDPDKLEDIDGFHADFVTGFKEHSWWDRHRQLNRHHLTEADGVRDDVNLIDVLDFIADCVMAGMARSGSVYPLHLSPELLERAFQNTVTLLKAEVVVSEPAASAQATTALDPHAQP